MSIAYAPGPPARSRIFPESPPTQHRDDAFANSHRATEHRRGKRLCARRVLAEMYLGLLHGTTGLGKFRELPPRRIHVAVVAYRLREIGGTSRYQRHLAGGGVEVFPIALFKKSFRDAGVREKPHSARSRVKRSRLDLLEHATVDCGEENGATVVGAREIDDFLYRFHVSGFLPFRLDRRAHRVRRACRHHQVRPSPSRSLSPRICS